MKRTSSLLVAGRGGADDPAGGLFRFDRSGSAWSGRKLAVVQQLSSLARHPDLPVVYGTSGIGADGRIHAWRVEEHDEGAAELASAGSGGAEPCFVAVEPGGAWLVVANYTSGNLATWQLDGAGVPVSEPVVTELAGDGAGVEPDRQDRPHPHQLLFAGDRLLVPDLGSDLVRRFRFDGAGIAEQVDAVTVPAGTGPRHAAVTGAAKISRAAEIGGDAEIAVSGELAQSVVVASAENLSAIPSTRRTGPARSRSERNYPGDLKIGPAAGYVANRGYDTIGVFSLGPEPRLVAEVETGVLWPQHLLLDDDALLVASWDSSQVVSLPLGPDGIPGEPTVLFDCPGAAWLLRLAESSV